MTDENGKRIDRRWLIHRAATKAADWLLVAVLAGAVALLTPAWDRLGAIWDSPERLDRMIDTQQQILERIEDLSGANRVLHQPPGQSFVREPVTQGDIIVFVLVAGRTEAGAGCVYRGVVPLFTDESGAKTPGGYKGRGRQFGTNIVRTEMRIAMPDEFPAGRATLELQLEYQCGEETVFELTYPVTFRVLPKD